jgi:hypothetical protein
LTARTSDELSFVRKTTGRIVALAAMKFLSRAGNRAAAKKFILTIHD